MKSVRQVMGLATAAAVSCAAALIPSVALAATGSGAPGSGAAATKVTVTPNGATVYVANFHGASVTPVNTATGKAATPIKVGPGPEGIAVTPVDATGAPTSCVAGYQL